MLWPKYQYDTLFIFFVYEERKKDWLKEKTLGQLDLACLFHSIFPGSNLSAEVVIFLRLATHYLCIAVIHGDARTTGAREPFAGLFSARIGRLTLLTKRRLAGSMAVHSHNLNNI